MKGSGSLYKAVHAVLLVQIVLSLLSLPVRGAESIESLEYLYNHQVLNYRDARPPGTLDWLSIDLRH